MKLITILIAAFSLFSCGGAGGPYEGKVTNNLCALEVYPVEIAKLPDSLKAKPDTTPKPDPLVRQQGIMKCRTY